MPITHLSGLQLKRAVISGAQRVIQMQEQLNNINVFPVPDSDTGTNMALTMRSAAEGALLCKEGSIHGMSRAVADSALMGARGNSGAILAQFFQGLAEGFQGRARATLEDFAQAVQRAASNAAEAIAEPKEGTILTVIHDWSHSI
jgi:dihydroxyacetone kinase-like predicted kinase